MAASFLQSGEWEEFQRSLGRKTWRAQDALVICHAVSLGMNYLYCPRPDFGLRTPDSGFWDEAREIARKEKSIFLKIDPIINISVPASSVQHPASGLQPQKTVILDLQKSEHDLLAAMREKTRYNIRLAQKKGVAVRTGDTGNTADMVDAFWQLLEETVRRDRFRCHERRHYERLLGARSGAFSNELFFAEYQGRALAAAIVNFYRPSRTASYLHGASSRMHKEAMASQLLHWEIALEAKRRGFLQYDFWGIDEEKWPGLTRFKMGFGGSPVSYPQAIDAVYRPWKYSGYLFFKKSV